MTNHKQDMEYGTEPQSKVFCEDCGETLTEYKDLRGYCPRHLQERVLDTTERLLKTTPQEKWEEWVKVLAKSKNPRDLDLLIVKIKVLLSSTLNNYRKEVREKVKMLPYHSIPPIDDDQFEFINKNAVLSLLEEKKS